MLELHIIISPPYGMGGRRSAIHDQLLRKAFRLHDRTMFLPNAGRAGRHEPDVVGSRWNVRHEDSSEVRGH
ncbi:hypothetical protein ACFZCU_43560 [Streptomyces canus]|uniref:hypothetical protein n=1 Tax=Streptomyces canus TaxID=58343 RepID=UPI0036E2BBBC